MPTSAAAPKKQPRKNGTFFYWDKNGRKADAKIHDPILAEGDHKRAQAVSRQIAKKIGITDAEFDLIMEKP